MSPADPSTPPRRRPLGPGAAALRASGTGETPAAQPNDGPNPGTSPAPEAKAASGPDGTERLRPGEHPAPDEDAGGPARPEPAADGEPLADGTAGDGTASTGTASTGTVRTAPGDAASAPGPGADRGGTAEPVPQDAGPREAPDAAQADTPAPGEGRFRLRLDNFEGPFDLLLQLISRHRLDVTEIALARVTDEFLAHLRAMGPDGDLDQTTEFLVVAATLLDLKAARLLPAAEVEDEGDLALLEARDLLFARLLQYRAYKRVAEIFAERLGAEARRHPRTVGLEPHHAQLLPEVMISVGPEGFAALAVKAMQPKPVPQVYVDHIHAPLVSVREQAGVVVERLRAAGAASFAELTADAPDTLTVVARFLALLELYRERAVQLDQPEALGPLLVRWSGAAQEAGDPLVTDEFDQEASDE
ncbi:segregation/condensation protein A [Streptomyces sp. AA0539]|uniref:segregation/condensation protein A n=1 Tax=Streptomyces sp. AA0539 TaxID=1210045 RepID=UPI0003051965